MCGSSLHLCLCLSFARIHLLPSFLQTDDHPLAMAAGAKVNTLVKSVTTNVSSFERAPSTPYDSAEDLMQWEGSKGAPRPASHRLVVHPRHYERPPWLSWLPTVPSKFVQGKLGGSREVGALLRRLGVGRGDFQALKVNVKIYSSKRTCAHHGARFDRLAIQDTVSNGL